MVLQRERPIHIWGWAEPGETVTVAFHSTTQSTNAGQLGEWSVYLPPQPAGGPFDLEVKASDTIELSDVLVGDVWLASGQSNMEMPLKGFPGSAVVNQGAEEIRNAQHPEMRLLLVRQKASGYPLDDFESAEGWNPCTPETAANFSAVAYFFGRQIAQEERVPIGLIDSTWGGTPVEAWLSLGGIASDPGLMPVFAARAEMLEDQANQEARVAAEKREDAAAREAHQPPPRHSWHPNPDSWSPAGLFNGMIAPAVKFAIKGVIWYQGESNSVLTRAPLYEKLFPALIKDWRKRWGEGDFPFLFVQLANFTSTPGEAWPVIREAQLRTLALTNTGMAVTIDVGDPANVHPSDKQTVGRRLALAAGALAYGKAGEFSGPLFRQATPESHSIRIWFDHASGLTAKGDTLEGFEVAGSDHRFFSAQGRIEGSTVVATAPK